jgi:putative DNA primase/helicase
LKRIGQERVGPCPRCGGTNRFAINPQKRRWLCRRCKPKGGGDPISLAMHIAGVDFVEAIEALTGVRASDGRRRVTRARQTAEGGPEGHGLPGCGPNHSGASGAILDRHDDEAARTRNLGMAKRIVSELVPLAGTFGETYLAEQRGIDVEAIGDVLERSDTLGWHPEVFFREPGHPLDGQYLWAIIGVMTDPVTAKPTGAISRTYIDPSGRKLGKAKTLGVPAGIVRLSLDEDVLEGLHLAEGIETALTGMAAEYRPMWSAGSTGLMAKFPVLRGIEALTLIADHDA